MENRKARYMAMALACLMAVTGITGCTASSNQNPSSATTEAASPSEKMEFTDDLGRTVEIENPKRVAFLIGSFADEFIDAGGKERIVAAPHDAWTSFDLDLGDDVADLGDVKNISSETLIASAPDLVIASAKNESQKQMLETLDQAGIPVLYYDVSTFEDYLRTLDAFCKLTGDEEAYIDHGQSQQEAIEAIQNTERSTTPKVLALRETGKGIKALGSENSLLGAMLADLKTENIAGDGGFDTLSMETIQLENPDYIFYVAQGKDLEMAQEMADRLFSEEVWKNLDAVKNGHVYVLDQKLYNLKPNAKWAKALQELESKLYDE